MNVKQRATPSAVSLNIDHVLRIATENVVEKVKFEAIQSGWEVSERNVGSYPCTLRNCMQYFLYLCL